MKRFLIAFQFLTILPVSRSLTADGKDISGSTSYFVLVGLIQGLLLVITGYIAGMVFHPDLVIAVVLLVYILSNGGFHLDGLADTLDAVAAKPGGDAEKDRDKRLAIMKDGSTGPAGVVAIVMALALKYLALKNISHMLYFDYYSALLLMPVIPKWAMVISIFHGKPARQDGLGRALISNIRARNALAATLLIILIFAVLNISFSRYVTGTQHLFYAVLLVVMYLLCRFFVSCSARRFGGLTGDVLGAVGELTEIIFLFMVILWSRLFTS